jgi:hypothetical protein
VLLCLLLCSLPVVLPAIVHGATVAILALGIGGASDVITFAPYSAPGMAPVAPVPPGGCAIREGAVYSAAPLAREYDRRGRMLPMRDARGRFVRTNAV